MEINEVLQGPNSIPGSGDGFPFEALPELNHEVDGDRQSEMLLALTIREARESLVALYRELPTDCRAYVLDGCETGRRRTRRWSLDCVEVCWERLVRFESTNPSPVVTRAVQLAGGYKADLDGAREALVLANAYIVPHVVKRFSNGIIPFADLVQDGYVGLMKAVDRFDPDRGYRFSTYAFWWIRRSMSEAFTHHSRLIRLPDSLRENLRRMRSVRDELREELGRRPTPQELAERMEVSLKKINKLLHVAPEPNAIDDLAHGGDESWGTLTRGAEHVDPLTSAIGNEMQAQAHEALEQLDPRERRVIRLRFGFDHDECMTLSQVGEVVGLSRERVRQIERIAMNKIHDWACRTGLAA
jgi:RNA polymerase primary sigma factor